MGYWDRIHKYMQGGPEAIDGWPALIPVQEFNQALARTLGSALSASNFEAVAPRRWVRSNRAPIRDVVELQALKGISYCPMWGLSLDFVPHITAAGDTKWHRTPKSARFDLVYRPIDYLATNSDARDWSVSLLATREELQEDLARVTQMVLAEAIPFLDRIVAVQDLPSLYREHRRRPSIGLSFDCFPQQVLAAAFVFAKCGDTAGQSELAEYIRAYDVAPGTARRLEELIAAAAA